ncbi:MAG: hypothetical protein BWY16_00782 [Candidatus Omnitrophica bacterium ADurb.Bin205]|nr:MAG: hypothetical protein BWY16_00782 [Candidatus Omnitrophica bacterium ADurb.Bin205]
MIFKREKIITVKEENLHLLLIEGYIKDDFHHITCALVVGYPSFEIKDVKVGLLSAPMQACQEATKLKDNLRGLKIKPGFLAKIRKAVGGPQGCIHLAELLYDMGQVAFQSSRKILNRTISNEEIEEKSQEFMKGKCIAFK